MRQRSRSQNQKLEALVDERDDLQVKISLAGDAIVPDADELRELTKRLAQVEKEIAVKLRNGLANIPD